MKESDILISMMCWSRFSDSYFFSTFELLSPLLMSIYIEIDTLMMKIFILSGIF